MICYYIFLLEFLSIWSNLPPPPPVDGDVTGVMVRKREREIGSILSRSSLPALLCPPALLDNNTGLLDYCFDHIYCKPTKQQQQNHSFTTTTTTTTQQHRPKHITNQQKAAVGAQPFIITFSTDLSSLSLSLSIYPSSFLLCSFSFLHVSTHEMSSSNSSSNSSTSSQEVQAFLLVIAAGLCTSIGAGT